MQDYATSRTTDRHTADSTRAQLSNSGARFDAGRERGIYFSKLTSSRFLVTATRALCCRAHCVCQHRLGKQLKKTLQLPVFHIANGEHRLHSKSVVGVWGELVPSVLCFWLLLPLGGLDWPLDTLPLSQRYDDRASTTYTSTNLYYCFLIGHGTVCQTRSTVALDKQTATEKSPRIFR